VKNPDKPDNLVAPALTLPYSTRYTDKFKQKMTIDIDLLMLNI
jgi:hypothetical protein